MIKMLTDFENIKADCFCGWLVAMIDIVRTQIARTFYIFIVEWQVRTCDLPA